MLVGRKKDIKDTVALTGGTQPLTGSKYVERIFLFLDHLASLMNLIFNIKTNMMPVNNIYRTTIIPVTLDR
jgi:hypothetical protein